MKLCDKSHRFLALALSQASLLLTTAAARADQLAGWGNNANGQLNALAGNGYAPVAPGGYHSLPLKAAGSLVSCIGLLRQANVPAGNDSVPVTAGDMHSVPLKANRTLVASGLNGNLLWPRPPRPVPLRPLPHFTRSTQPPLSALTTRVAA